MKYRRSLRQNLPRRYLPCTGSGVSTCRVDVRLACSTATRQQKPERRSPVKKPQSIRSRRRETRPPAPPWLLSSKNFDFFPPSGQDIEERGGQGEGWRKDSLLLIIGNLLKSLVGKSCELITRFYNVPQLVCPRDACAVCQYLSCA